MSDHSQALLHCVGALEHVSATARTLSGNWESRVLPAHAELERLCATALKTATPEAKADAVASNALEPLSVDADLVAAARRAHLAVGSCVHFVQRSAAIVEATVATANTRESTQEQEQDATSVLAAAVRLLLCILISEWVENSARSESWPLTLFPIAAQPSRHVGLHRKLLLCCDSLLSKPQLSPVAAPKLFAASLLLRPTSVAEALRIFFKARAR